MAKISAAQAMVRVLRGEGVDTVFTLTGGHILPLLDAAVVEGLRVIDVRHEQAAAHAADAYARLTGRLGVAVVTAGPGATDAVTGIAAADGAYTVFNVPAGSVTVRGYAAGLQLDSAAAEVAAGETTTGVDLGYLGAATAVVSGKIEIVGIVDGEIFLRYHEAKRPADAGKLMRRALVPGAGWLDDLEERPHDGIQPDQPGALIT